MLMDSFMFLAKPVRPDEVHSSGWKLVFNQDQCTVPEIITILQDSTNSMRNPTPIIATRRWNRSMVLVKGFGKNFN